MTANNPERPSLEIAITGEGVVPSEVPVRELAELLAAATQLFSALSRDGADKISLSAIRVGSACYGFGATQPVHDPIAESLFGATWSAIERRGVDDRPEVGRALARLHRVGAQRGAIRVRANLPGRPAGQHLILAAPLETVPTLISSVTSLYGTIVGVEATRSRFVVRLRPDDGAKIDVEADAKMAERAGRLFNHSVSVTVRYDWDLDAQRGGWELLDIQSWHDQSLIDVLAEIRREASVDLGALLNELEEDA